VTCDDDVVVTHDKRGNQWCAFTIKDGRPMLASAETEREAVTWLYELIEGENDAQH
jgi:hypothetical protein